MTDTGCVAVRLELDSRADPIRGLLTDADGEVRVFVGWLGLASAIEHVLAAGAPHQPERAEHPA